MPNSKLIPSGSNFNIKYIPWKKWTKTYKDAYNIEQLSDPETKNRYGISAKWKFTDTNGKVTFHGISLKLKSTRAPTKAKQMEHMVTVLNQYTKLLSRQVAANKGIIE